MSHIGLSPGGQIHDNQIYYNDSVDSGAGIAIEGELVLGGATLSDGSGSVNVDRNLIQSNFSGDDGGGVFVLDARTAEINLRNNMIVNNGAADMGGAVTLDDASNVRLVNNTVANNVSTGTSENSAVGVPRSAGLASETNDPLFQATLPGTAPRFSNPVALFNNIFWNNQTLHPRPVQSGGDTHRRTVRRLRDPRPDQRKPDLLQREIQPVHQRQRRAGRWTASRTCPVAGRRPLRPRSWASRPWWRTGGTSPAWTRCSSRRSSTSSR